MGSAWAGAGRIDAETGHRRAQTEGLKFFAVSTDGGSVATINFDLSIAIHNMPEPDR